jgi:putative transposase
MGNHYHLLIQTPLANLGVGMRDLNSQYVAGFNRRHDRDGGLLKRPYKAQLVQDDRYLLAAARYIAMNPVRAGLVERPEDWGWSSFADLWRGAPSPLLPLIDEHRDHARRLFIDLVRDGAGLPPFEPEKAIFGDAAFVARHAPELPPEQPVERRSWDQARPPLVEVASQFRRDEAIARARIDYRYTVKEIAEHFGCSTETVRRRLRMWDVRTSPL